MVSTTFTRETRLAVDLPEAEAASSEAINDQIEVLVSQSGRYSVNSQVLESSDTRTLGAALVDAAQGDRRRPVLLVADAEATHQAVVTAMDAIGQAGFSRLSIATRQPTSDGNTTE